VCFDCVLRLCILLRPFHCGCPLSTSSSPFSGHRLPFLLHLVLMSARASVSFAVRPSWAVILHAEVRLLCLLSLFVWVCVGRAGFVFFVSGGGVWFVLGGLGMGMSWG
jgi:hypothetical protein